MDETQNPKLNPTSIESPNPISVGEIVRPSVPTGPKICERLTQNRPTAVPTGRLSALWSLLIEIKHR